MELYRNKRTGIVVQAAQWIGKTENEAKAFIADHDLWSFSWYKGRDYVWLVPSLKRGNSHCIQPGQFVVSNIGKPADWVAINSYTFLTQYEKVPPEPSLLTRVIEFFKRI